MIEVEKIIEKVQLADEVELMEYDFSECFTALREMKRVIQMCFDDSCKPSGKVSKKTALALMKIADTRA